MRLEKPARRERARLAHSASGSATCRTDTRLNCPAECDALSLARCGDEPKLLLLDEPFAVRWMESRGNIWTSNCASRGPGPV